VVGVNNIALGIGIKKIVVHILIQLLIFCRAWSGKMEEVYYLPAHRRRLHGRTVPQDDNQLFGPSHSGNGNTNILLEEVDVAHHDHTNIQGVEDKTMETETGRPNLGATFFQCKAARKATVTETIFDLKTGLKLPEQLRRKGCLDRTEDNKVSNIFL
jgi:hypothetical protein